MDRRTAGWAMIIAPLAVLPAALVAAGFGWAAQLGGAPTLISGALVVGVLTLGTRALHLDGLADTIDGLGSGWDRAKALAVMRRGDVGPMGVAGLVIVMMAQAAAFGAMTTDVRGALRVAGLICCSRAAVSVVCLAGRPAARSDGLGVAVAGSVRRSAAVVVGVLVASATIGGAAVTGQSLLLASLAVVGALLAVVGLVRHCVRRFGGVTGDVMGAAIEVAATILALISVLRWPS